MAINNLPSQIAAAIQTGFLERQFRQALKAKLGFRAIADQEPFSAKIGETITKTRTGLLAANTTPMAPASNTDITSGLTPQQFGLEQYTLAIAQYAVPMNLNIATAEVAIDDLYLQNAAKLGENAYRSVDTLAQKALYDIYQGGNTRVKTTLGSPGTTVAVDDVRGFFMAWTSTNIPTPVSGSNTLAVTFNNAGTLTTYTLTGCIADGTAPATINPWLANLVFSGSSSNTSTTPGGYSGTLTFSSNVSTANATAGNAVVAAVAPVIIRPTNATSLLQEATCRAIVAANDLNSGRLTMDMILAAKAIHSNNAVGVIPSAGSFVLYADAQHLTGLYADSAFQRLFTGKPDSNEYKRGIVANELGVQIVETNLNPVETVSGQAPIRRAVMCGAGALVEGVFTPTAMAAAQRVNDSGMITVVDGIAHITREPIDVLQEVITQSWAYMGGFVAPTDITTTTSTVPTANNAAWKRAIIIESL